MSCNKKLWTRGNRHGCSVKQESMFIFGSITEIYIGKKKFFEAEASSAVMTMPKS